MAGLWDHMPLQVGSELRDDHYREINAAVRERTFLTMPDTPGDQGLSRSPGSELGGLGAIQGAIPVADLGGDNGFESRGHPVVVADSKLYAYTASTPGSFQKSIFQEAFGSPTWRHTPPCELTADVFNDPYKVINKIEMYPVMNMAGPGEAPAGYGSTTATDMQLYGDDPEQSFVEARAAAFGALGTWDGDNNWPVAAYPPIIGRVAITSDVGAPPGCAYLYAAYREAAFFTADTDYIDAGSAAASDVTRVVGLLAVGSDALPTDEHFSFHMHVSADGSAWGRLGSFSTASPSYTGDGGNMSYFLGSLAASASDYVNAAGSTFLRVMCINFAASAVPTGWLGSAYGDPGYGNAMVDLGAGVGELFITVQHKYRG